MGDGGMGDGMEDRQAELDARAAARSEQLQQQLRQLEDPQKGSAAAALPSTSAGQSAARCSCLRELARDCIAQVPCCLHFTHKIRDNALQSACSSCCNDPAAAHLLMLGIIRACKLAGFESFTSIVLV